MSQKEESLKIRFKQLLAKLPEDIKVPIQEDFNYPIPELLDKQDLMDYVASIETSLQYERDNDYPLVRPEKVKQLQDHCDRVKWAY